jgi:hypothetical protein
MPDKRKIAVFVLLVIIAAAGAFQESRIFSDSSSRDWEEHLRQVLPFKPFNFVQTNSILIFPFYLIERILSKINRFYVYSLVIIYLYLFSHVSLKASHYYRKKSKKKFASVLALGILSSLWYTIAGGWDKGVALSLFEKTVFFISSIVLNALVITAYFYILFYFFGKGYWAIRMKLFPSESN